MCYFTDLFRRSLNILPYNCHAFFRQVLIHNTTACEERWKNWEEFWPLSLHQINGRPTVSNRAINTDLPGYSNSYLPKTSRLLSTIKLYVGSLVVASKVSIEQSSTLFLAAELWQSDSFNLHFWNWFFSIFKPLVLHNHRLHFLHQCLKWIFLRNFSFGETIFFCPLHRRPHELNLVIQCFKKKDFFRCSLFVLC